MRRAQVIPPNKRLHILAMGAGVQTTTILMMALNGNYRKPDAIIFADLGWEAPATYRNLTFLKHHARIAGIPFHTIHGKDIRQDALASNLYLEDRWESRWASMPLYSLKPDGHKGMLRRQCTLEYKIRPIDKFIRQRYLGLKKNAKCPTDAVYLWLGISTDESRRSRIAVESWKIHTYPLLELEMSRAHCQTWLDDHGIHHPAKSACVGCPYRPDVEWKWLKQKQPDAFAEACAFDEAIRQPRLLESELFLHKSRQPLAEVDFSNTPNEDSDPARRTECLGYCGT